MLLVSQDEREKPWETSINRKKEKRHALSEVGGQRLEKSLQFSL
jgi:hypothetical protein